MDFFEFDDLYVRRLKEHDRETEEHFSNYFGSLLAVMLRKRLPNTDVDDVIQEVLARVLARLGDLRDGRKLGGFVLGFCNNHLKEWYRGKSRTESLNEKHETIPGRSNVEAELLSNETTQRVRQVLREMPRRDADILRAIFLEEEDKDDICRRFDVDRDYLRVLLHRAKKVFKSLFR